MRVALAGLRAVAVLAVPVVAVAGIAAGAGGALGAGIAVAVVAGMLATSGGLLAAAGRRGPEWVAGAALGGFLLRLIGYAALIVLLRPVEAIHGPSLALAAAVLLVCTLAYEVRVVQHTPALFWLDTRAASSARATAAPDGRTRT